MALLLWCPWHRTLYSSVCAGCVKAIKCLTEAPKKTEAPKWEEPLNDIPPVPVIDWDRIMEESTDVMDESLEEEDIISARDPSIPRYSPDSPIYGEDIGDDQGGYWMQASEVDQSGNDDYMYRDTWFSAMFPILRKFTRKGG